MAKQDTQLLGSANPEELKTPFFQVPTHHRAFSLGVMALPTRYTDASCVMATFEVDWDVANELIEAPDLELVRLPNGKAVMNAVFYEYRRLTNGTPYNEAGIALLVNPKGYPLPADPEEAVTLPSDRRQVGQYIVDLPVTTGPACAAGIDLWGYPKFVTEIPFALDGKNFAGKVLDPEREGEFIISLEGEAGAEQKLPDWQDLVLYSKFEDQLFRATSDTRSDEGYSAEPGNFVLKTSATSLHPMAVRIRRLIGESATPKQVAYTHHFQLRLNEGVGI
ncbi:acetoacetate decarboxylase family protein [Deinococcus sp. Marseille-Q6407]|uniref:acetoacetate decarboxylase family protein n=1 Tax=Deinococcus sp. Marseille-Q6407 TaxID=2969223 RepID=UPI0021BF591D|nr:acetoacetate decarboxylase family protein [Deinococcus sp. Marseille-Q6407]